METSTGCSETQVLPSVQTLHGPVTLRCELRTVTYTSLPFAVLSSYYYYTIFHYLYLLLPIAALCNSRHLFTLARTLAKIREEKAVIAHHSIT